MAAVYGYAETGGQQPDELILLGYIDRYGVEQVLGKRQLSAKEIREMTLADNVLRAYRSRQASENWAAWAEAHPGENRLLIEAMEQWQTHISE